jgi:hypothetical protein
MKVESFYCEHTSSLFGGKSPRQVALEYAIKILNENCKEGYLYRCNYDAFILIKPGCWRKILRFVMGRKKEQVLIIKFKYGIFEKITIDEQGQFEFIEVKPVTTDHILGAITDKKLHNPYLESGKIAVQQFIDKDPNVKPYCDLEVMVKVKPGCFKKVMNFIFGNSHKNKFTFQYFEFNIAQKFV